MKKICIATALMLTAMLSSNAFSTEEESPTYSYTYIVQKIDKDDYEYKVTLKKAKGTTNFNVFYERPLDVKVGDEVVITSDDKRIDAGDVISNPKNDKHSNLRDAATDDAR